MTYCQTKCVNISLRFKFKSNILSLLYVTNKQMLTMVSKDNVSTIFANKLNIELDKIQ